MRTASGGGRPVSLVNVVRDRASRLSTARCLTFVENGTRATEHLTIADLDLRARAIAAALTENTASGQRVVLVYPPGLEFVAGLFGCWYAGAVAVPATPPRAGRPSRLMGIVADAEPTTILTTSSLAEHLPPVDGVRALSTDSIPDAYSSMWSEGAPADVAVLQYTSGSTSVPKGVMVTHECLIHNLESIRRAFALDDASVSVTWLPHHHDMGLIDGLLEPIYGGFPGFVMSPLSFLQRPGEWLNAISHFQVTHSGGPNFAYELCVAKTTPEQREGLDLSGWTTAYNGAEPIRAETIERFAKAFAPCGFRERQFFPCYGLAEATLMVTGGAVGDPPRRCRVAAEELQRHRVVAADGTAGRAVTLVGSGHACADTTVRVVDPESKAAVQPEHVGEIWVSGPGVTAGYWRRPEESADFRARLATGEGPFLRTGDLGFLRDGQLFVTGRLKDMLIIRGRNHYPQDIELTAEQSHPVFRRGCAAAFTVDVDGADHLVVALEADDACASALDAAARAVRRDVADVHEVSVHDVVVLGPHIVPKTSSGKVRRGRCRALYVDGALDALRRTAPAPSAPPAGTEAPLRTRLEEATPEDRVDALTAYVERLVLSLPGVSAGVNSRSRPLAKLGLDSLGAIELTHRLELELGVVLPITWILDGASVEQIAARAATKLGATPADDSATGTAAHDDDNGHTVSAGQAALWFVDRLATGSAPLNVSVALRIESEVVIPRLKRAFTLLADRHPALRTSFTLVDGRVEQRASERPELDFEVVDATGWTGQQLDEYLVAESEERFDLEEGPLLRLRVCRRTPGEDVLLIAAHHIVVDFWSLSVLLRDLGTFYGALTDGAAVELPAAASPTEYARRQRAFAKGPAAERLVAHWRMRLAGAPQRLDLPTDRPRPAVRSFRGGTETTRWEPDLADRLRALATSRGVTLHTLLLAGFQLLLHRYSGQPDISVGVSSAGRTDPRFSNTVGYLVNQVVLRSQLVDDLPFTMYLERVKGAVLDALDHRDLPFPLLVERLNPERDPAHSPLFQAMFVHLNARHLGELAPIVAGLSGARADLGGLHVESAEIERRSAQFDLTVTIVEAPEDLAARWEYNSDLFDAAAIRRMGRHFVTLLEAVTRDPDRAVGSLPLLTPAEREQVLVEWNRTGAPSPFQAVHHGFERRAREASGAIAVRCGAETLTYRELDERANQLARCLIRRGAGPGSLVGIRLERSIELIVSLLGVLKSGAAYVPLEPEEPAERLALILPRRTAAVVTNERLASDLPSLDGVVVCIDADMSAIDAEARTPPGVEIAPASLAYVIHTSGSTGRPKGVMVTHEGLANYLGWCVDAYAVGRGSGAPVAGPVGFDATVTSLFAPLLAGTTVELLPQGQELVALSEALRLRDDYSFVKVTPAHLELLVQSAGPTDLAARSTRIVVGGDVLTGRAVAAWRSLAPGAIIVNEYGPTEAVVGCCAHEVTTDDVAKDAVPIGRPIANTEIYVLDGHGQPVPVGVTGELCVGGAGVARGYLDAPRLTAEAFVPHPFASEPGARLYRTGDRARYRADGVLEFVGRDDDQVKIRGFRVELADVEAALVQHEAVAAAAAGTWSDGAGQRRLVAYLVHEGTERLGAAELRSFLGRKLPPYMIPSVYVPLQRLPLTRNGKIDRSALPPPRAPEVPRGMPGSGAQHVVAEVWKAVLLVDEVGLDQNFFDLGGDSLMMAEVHRQLRARLDQEVTLVDLMQHPTVGALAGHLARGEPDASGLRSARSRAERRRRAQGSRGPNRGARPKRRTL